MANQYTKFSRDNVLRKMNRRKNPITSVVRMAQEFGVDTSYFSWERSQYRDAAPPTFRRQLKEVLTAAEYETLAGRKQPV